MVNKIRKALAGFRAHDRQPAHWTLTITHLQAPVDVRPDNFEEMKALFEEFGLIIEQTDLSSPDSYGWSMGPAEGVDIQSAMQAVEEHLGLWVSGPWVFPLDVPGSQP